MTRPVPPESVPVTVTLAQVDALRVELGNVREAALALGRKERLTQNESPEYDELCYRIGRLCVAVDSIHSARVIAGAERDVEVLREATARRAR